MIANILIELRSTERRAPPPNPAENQQKTAEIPNTAKPTNFTFALDPSSQNKTEMKSTPKFSFLRTLDNTIPNPFSTAQPIQLNSHASINRPAENKISNFDTTKDTSNGDAFMEFFTKSMQKLYSLGMQNSMKKTGALNSTTSSMAQFGSGGSASRKSSAGKKSVLKKRKRGRPRKNPEEKKKRKKKEIKQFELGAESQQVKKPEQSNTLVVSSKIGEEFYSDSENPLIDQIRITDTNSKELDFKLSFAPSSNIVIHPKEDLEKIKKEVNRLFLGKLLTAIQEQKKRSKVKKFMCRFCGKTFDKPSSLGGHTAKKHHGLSQKYRRRLDAAKNRKTERDRNNFIKKKLVEEMESKNGGGGQ